MTAKVQGLNVKNSTEEKFLGKNLNPSFCLKTIFHICEQKQVKNCLVLHESLTITSPKMKYSIKDFFSKCDQIRR